MKQRYGFVANSSSASYTVSRFNICDELYEAIKIGKTTFPVKGVGEVLITNKINMTLDAVAVHRIFKELTETCETITNNIILVPFMEDPMCYINQFSFIENQKDMITSTAVKTQSCYVGFYKDNKYYGELCCNIDKNYNKYEFISKIIETARNLSTLESKIGDWEFIDKDIIKVVISINSDFTPCVCEFKRNVFLSDVFTSNNGYHIKTINDRVHYCEIYDEYDALGSVIEPHSSPIGGCRYSEYKYSGLYY